MIDTDRPDPETQGLVELSDTEIFDLCGDNSSIRQILYQGYDSLRNKYGGSVLAGGGSNELRYALHLSQDLPEDQFVIITHNPEHEATSERSILTQESPYGPIVYTRSKHLLWHLQCLAIGASTPVQGMGRIEEVETHHEDDGSVTVLYGIQNGELAAIFHREKVSADEILHPLSIVLRLDPLGSDDGLAG